MLGVEPDASDDTIKRAWRRLAREWHPDRNPAPEAAERFKELSSAWELLSDPARRRSLDLRARRSGTGPLPEEFLDAVASAVERAQDWIEREVLPHYLGGARGRGTEAAARLWLDVGRLVRPRSLPVTARGRRRAAALLATLQVVMDERPCAALSLLVPGRRRRVIVVYPAALWDAGFRDPVEIDDAILRVLLLRYAQVVATGRLPSVGTALDPAAEARVLDLAREADDREVRARALRAALWAAVALVAAFLLTAGFFQW